MYSSRVNLSAKSQWGFNKSTHEEKSDSLQELKNNTAGSAHHNNSQPTHNSISENSVQISNALKKENNTFKHRYQDLKQRYDALDKDYNILLEDCNTLKQNSNFANEKYEKTIKDTDNIYRELQEKYSKLHAKNKELTLECKSLRGVNKKPDAELEALLVKYKALEVEYDELERNTSMAKCAILSLIIIIFSMAYVVCANPTLFLF